jgi:two-component system cell cycle sensor histidine kinase/response regulator CckA
MKPAREPLRVLIIEHDPVDAELELATLERAGFEVTSTVLGTRGELEARLGESEFDIVLADYRLPGWTGMDAFNALRARGLDTPFIFVTGTMGEERAVESLLQGVADYILKTNLARLPVAVRRAVGDAKARAERAREQELIRKLTLAVDQSPASILITSLDGTIEYVNARFEEVTGHSRAEAVGATPRLLSSGRTPRTTYEAMWACLRSGSTWKGEIENRRANGQTYWDEVTISPLRDESGRITHYVAVQEDVTERRTYLAELSRREEQYRQLAENIAEVFFVVDVDFRRTIFVNHAYERVWGRSVASIYAEPFSFMEAVHADDRERLLANLAQVQAGEDPGSIEFRVVHPDGSVRSVLSHAAPVRDELGRLYRISGFALDVTDRRRAADALAASEHRLRMLLETVNLIVLVLDLDGRVEYLNPFALALTGYSREEVVGTDWFTRFLPEGERVELRAVFTEMMASDRHAHHRNAVHAKAGGRRMIAWHNTVLRDEAGRPTGSLSVGEDVTERDRLEDQLRQSQKMEAVGRLAGGVAHDFNNLLTVIISYAQMLRDRLPPHDERIEEIEPILTAADSAAGLTRQLLAFSRQQVIQPRPVVLEDVVSQSAKLLRRVIGEDVTLQLRLDAPGGAVIIDPGQLDQVIMNLAVNARDAMPQGGTLGIETAAVELDDAYAQAHFPAVSGKYVRLTMSDTGVGMDAATSARIFEPFFTTKEAGKGTGLGLATVYGIVKQSNGFIWVYSEPGLGSTFRIYLPLCAGPATTPVAPAARVPEGTETLLVVEDAAAVRAVVRKLLEACGYAVIEATSPREALDIARRRAGPIDLLLTDVVMPEMSGKALADGFAPLRPEARVLFMSGYTDDSIVRHGVLEPGVNYLQKPFTREAIARAVREVLDA